MQRVATTPPPSPYPSPRSEPPMKLFDRIIILISTGILATITYKIMPPGLLQKGLSMTIITLGTRLAFFDDNYRSSLQKTFQSATRRFNGGNLKGDGGPTHYPSPRHRESTRERSLERQDESNSETGGSWSTPSAGHPPPATGGVSRKGNFEEKDK